VYICTSAITRSQYCAQEKINWIRRHLGESWIDRILITSNKTLVAGDILIDDKPSAGQESKGWKQVLFDAPYNRNCSGPRLRDWREWRTVVYEVLNLNDPELGNTMKAAPVLGNTMKVAPIVRALDDRDEMTTVDFGSRGDEPTKTSLNSITMCEEDLHDKENTAPPNAKSQQKHKTNKSPKNEQFLEAYCLELNSMVTDYRSGFYKFASRP